jgi:hypothetical protein
MFGMPIMSFLISKQKEDPMEVDDQDLNSSSKEEK